MTERKERSYWTVMELADRWQVTERAVRKWIVEGAFPGAYKVGLGKGSHYRIPPEDVVSFEQRRKVNRSGRGGPRRRNTTSAPSRQEVAR